ncbi:MAG TPA: thioredoxin domain-containing protein, partial [Gemmatimonadales bacterium]|nr:thioredoxin domain-containing protein [Gemmatimonadales bacterium]
TTDCATAGAHPRSIALGRTGAACRRGLGGRLAAVLRVAAVAAALVAAVRPAAAQSTSTASPAKPHAAEAAPADPLAARSKGSPTAPITVYEMSDFQCPYCRRHAVDVFPALEEAYVKTGKVRWVYINFPLTQIHPNAAAAAQLAMCGARSGSFWPLHDLLFKYQDVWAPLKEPGPFLLSLADSAKVPKAPLVQCLTSQATLPEIQADASGAERSGAGSTPSFYIEGGMLVGAQPVAVWRQVLDSIYAAKTKPRS